MSEEENKKPADPHHHHHHHHQYGTFQGVANYAPPTGFPQPVPPPGVTGEPSADVYYGRAYQGATVQGYAVAEGTPVREPRLPCCGIGFGWFLFILGFVTAAIPWYIGAFIILCSRVDHREKPGYVACVVGAILFTIALVLGVTKGANDW